VVVKFVVVLYGRGSRGSAIPSNDPVRILGVSFSSKASVGVLPIRSSKHNTKFPRKQLSSSRQWQGQTATPISHKKFKTDSPAIPGIAAVEECEGGASMHDLDVSKYFNDLAFSTEKSVDPVDFLCDSPFPEQRASALEMDTLQWEIEDFERSAGAYSWDGTKDTRSPLRCDGILPVLE